MATYKAKVADGSTMDIAKEQVEAGGGEIRIIDSDKGEIIFDLSEDNDIEVIKALGGVDPESVEELKTEVSAR